MSPNKTNHEHYQIQTLVHVAWQGQRHDGGNTTAHIWWAIYPQKRSEAKIFFCRTTRGAVFRRHLRVHYPALVIHPKAKQEERPLKQPHLQFLVYMLMHAHVLKLRSN